MRGHRGDQPGERGRGRWRVGVLVAISAMHLAGRAGADPSGALDPGPAGEVKRSALEGAAAQDPQNGQVCLEGRAAAYLDWTARVGGLSEEPLERLRLALYEAVEDAVEDARRSAGSPAPDWVEAAWQAALTSRDRTAAWEAVLKAEQRAALEADWTAREGRVKAASVEVLLTTLAVELRLRQAQAEALREPLLPLLSDPRWRRDLATNADPTPVMVAFEPVRALLKRDQLNRLMRMRPASNRGSGGRGALPLRSGRYPEDEFVLEALALAAFHGWDDEQAALLIRGATTIGRRVRREQRSSLSTGDRNLLRAVVDLNQQPLWKALVRREEARLGVDGPAPAPWRSDDRRALVDARSRLMLAYLDRALLLEDGPREALDLALQEEVSREIDRGTLGLGAIGVAPIWRALRLSLRFSAGEAATQPRPELLADLRRVLSLTQLRALGIEEERR